MFQVLQQDIQNHSKIVSAVLRLCQRLGESDPATTASPADLGRRNFHQLIAGNLERRWHSVLLQSLEWQCRLEEALTQPPVSADCPD